MKICSARLLFLVILFQFFIISVLSYPLLFLYLPKTAVCLIPGARPVRPIRPRLPPGRGKYFSMYIASSTVSCALSILYLGSPIFRAALELRERVEEARRYTVNIKTVRYFLFLVH